MQEERARLSILGMNTCSTVLSVKNNGVGVAELF